MHYADLGVREFVWGRRSTGGGDFSQARYLLLYDVSTYIRDFLSCFDT